MARKNNPRNLRASFWSNPAFCLYVGQKQILSSWAGRLQTLNSTRSFLNKVFLKNKRNKNKKKNLFKTTRFVVMNSAYSMKVFPLLSKAVPARVLSQLNKVLKKKYKSGLRQKSTGFLRRKSFRRNLSLFLTIEQFAQESIYRVLSKFL